MLEANYRSPYWKLTGLTESSFRCHELGIACGKVTSRCARAELSGCGSCGSAPPGDEMDGEVAKQGRRPGVKRI